MLEKPQYTVSYNNRIKAPNWVSWQLDKSWLGSVNRPGTNEAPSSYPDFNPPNTYFYADDQNHKVPDSQIKVDYPWVSDQSLPFQIKTEGRDYRFANDTLSRGHIAASSDRNRHLKDVYGTFSTSNLIPQTFANNSAGTAWRRFEQHTRNLANNNKELYLIAGGYLYDELSKPAGFPAPQLLNFVKKINNVPENQIPEDSVTDHVLLAKSLGGNDSFVRPNPKGILVPAFTWKIAAILEPGQGISDIDDSTQIHAIITPNRKQPGSIAINNIRLPASQTYPNGFPFGQPLTLANYNNWEQWCVSVDYLEELTDNNFFSHLPEAIQNIIEDEDHVSCST